MLKQTKLLSMEIEKHRDFSKLRLKEISNRFSQIPELKGGSLCVFATGSYGRLEASENSDIDLFFLDIDEKKETTNLNKTIINAEIIKICRNLGLPEFSNDGLYLKSIWLKELKAHLGSPLDDFNNYFTARLLMLLESKPLYCDDLYNKSIDTIINCYYMDFHDHTKNFKPIFLANDIIRFWKTLCLNYEHKRIKDYDNFTKDTDEHKKLVTHTKNLKLKFSRKLTCFSFILCLVDFNKTITQTDIKSICMLSPTERLEYLKDRNKDVGGKIQKALNSYQWFIDKTQVPSNEMIDWIKDRKERDNAFDRSRQFEEEIFEILQVIDKQNIMSKLLI